MKSKSIKKMVATLSVAMLMGGVIAGFSTISTPVTAEAKVSFNADATWNDLHRILRGVTTISQAKKVLNANGYNYVMHPTNSNGNILNGWGWHHEGNEAMVTLWAR